eukprot:scaffold263614_cov25-Tisochrysis_lutea.AAC.2
MWRRRPRGVQTCNETVRNGATIQDYKDSNGARAMGEKIRWIRPCHRRDKYRHGHYLAKRTPSRPARSLACTRRP